MRVAKLTSIPFAAIALFAAAPISHALGQSSSPSEDRSSSAPPAPAKSARAEAPPDGSAARPAGAQVLPLPAPDASTARGQERGNARLRSNESPTAGEGTSGRSPPSDGGE